MGFDPVIGETNHFVLNKVHRTDDRLEIADHNLDASIWEGADFGIGCRQL